jgi:hypothetical protein
MSIASNGQPANAEPSLSFVDAGIANARILEEAKARFPIFFSFEASPKATLSRREQFSKHFPSLSPSQKPMW